jgi:ABC-type glycerol-3-phosphate transport system substrate-binding protein
MKKNLGALAAILLGAIATSPAIAADPVKLVFWSMWNETEPQAKALQALMADYSQAHPDVTFQAVWNGRQNQTKIRSALAAGTAIDFVDQDADQIAGGLMKEGLAHPIDAALGTPIAGEAKPFRDIFLPGTLDLLADGQTHYLIPYVYNTVNFWYNKDMLRDAGVAAPPATWDDLLAMCTAVAGQGHDALVIESNVGGYNLLYFSHLIERQKGAGAVLKLFQDKTGEGWRDPAVLAAAKAERQLWDRGCIGQDARGFQYPAGQQTIALGDSAGELVGSWLPTELTDSAGADFPWGSFNFPAVSGGAGKATDLEVALLAFMVLKDSKHADEAVDFLKFVMSEKGQKTLVETGGVGVTRAGVAWPAVLQSAYEAASNATGLSLFGGGLQVAYPDFNATVLTPEHNKMFLGEITPEQLVDTLAAKTKEYWASKS